MAPLESIEYIWPSLRRQHISTYCDLQDNWKISTACNGFWNEYTTEPRRSVFHLFCKSQYINLHPWIYTCIHTCVETTQARRRKWYCQSPSIFPCLCACMHACMNQMEMLGWMEECVWPFLQEKCVWICMHTNMRGLHEAIAETCPGATSVHIYTRIQAHIDLLHAVCKEIHTNTHIT
jgi:hypothetical protein